MKVRVPGDKRFPGFKDATLPTAVYCYGRPHPDCVAVDTATGVAWRHKRNPDGSLDVDYQREEVRIERVIGSFRVVPGKELGATG